MDQRILAIDGHMAFDHLGVLVPNLAHGARSSPARSAYVTGPSSSTIPSTTCSCSSASVRAACYEAVAPRSVDSPVRNALKRRINVFNHIAYRVVDLATEAKRLQQAGFTAIAGARPAVAYDGHPIQFFINADLFLLELIEAAEHRHLYVEQV